MVRTLKTFVLVGALVMGTASAHATIITLPIVGDIEHPDMDPFHVLSPAPAAAPEAAPAPAPKKHHKKKKKKM